LNAFASWFFRFEFTLDAKDVSDLLFFYW